MKKRVEEMVSEKILGMANYTVKNTVGKCFPVMVHEVKMPESVRKEFLEKGTDK